MKKNLNLDNINEYFNKKGFAYLPDLIVTKECQSKIFKYLTKKFKNVTVILINEKIEKYRIGSISEDAIFGKDYIIFEKNLNYNPLEIKNFKNLPFNC